MKTLKTVAVVVLSIGLSFSGGMAQKTLANLKSATSAAPDAYFRLLEKYVTLQGVRYAAWHSDSADMEALKQVVAFYSETLPPADKKESLAWYLNAYNAWILHSILSKYPTKGPLDGDLLFFRKNSLLISGQKTNFNDLEQKVIRPVFKEARVHFALNCASASCPPLSQQPFSASNLDARLDELTRAFVNANSRAIQIQDGGKTIQLSKIFDWYKSDFQSSGGIISFINHYRDTMLPTDDKIEFIDYDWSLNESK